MAAHFHGTAQTGSAMTSQLTVLYDADCGLCTQTVRVLARLDTRRRLRPVSLQASALPGLPPREELLRALHAVDSKGKMFVGAGAAVEIARRVPPLWPISLVAKLPFGMSLLNTLYQAVADNRRGLGRLFRLKACRVVGDARTRS